MKKTMPHPHSPAGQKIIAKIGLKAFQKRVKWSSKNIYSDFPQVTA